MSYHNFVEFYENAMENSYEPDELYQKNFDYEIPVKFIDTIKHFRGDHPCGFDVNKIILLNEYINDVCFNRELKFDLENLILRDFPLDMLIEIIKIFIYDPYAFGYDGNYEISKIIYVLWLSDNPNSYFICDDFFDLSIVSDDIRKELKWCFDTITRKLNTLKKLSKEELFEKRRKYYSYYNFHILAFIPLISVIDHSILNYAYKLDYDDAQDLLMFALYQYNPDDFRSKLIEILKYWLENNNICFQQGTGMTGQLKIILEKYKDDPIIYDILKQAELY